MNHKELLDLTDEVHEKCKQILSKKKKSRELPDDRLFQFRLDANLRQCSMIEAVADMMTKHTTQFYTMVKEHSAGVKIAKKVWESTILDHINYLYLTLAVLEEDDE